MKVSLSEQQNKKSVEDWLYDHFTSVLVLIIFSVIIVAGFVTYERLSINWNNFVEQRERSYEFRSIIRDDLLGSTDCKLLKGAILESYSRGESPDEWFPDIDDRALKIGEKRYSLLCEPVNNGVEG